MSRKVGRNDPCPCGSGKKYKKCCLDKLQLQPMVAPSSELDELKIEFENYDRAELIATIGGLQLYAENHSETIRLEVATRVACSMKNDGTKRVEVDDIQKVLNKCLPADGPAGIMEDPTENLFTENIVFHGGNYIVYSGITGGGVLILRTLFQTVSQYNEGLSKKFIAYVEAISHLLLTLSNSVVSRAGHLRYMESPDTWRRDIKVPETDQTNRFSNSVRFTKREINTLLESERLNFGFLSPFMISVGDKRLEEEDLMRNPLLVRPFVEINNSIILALPGSIIGTLRHSIWVAAEKLGLLEILAKRFREVLWISVQKCLRLMFFKPVELVLPEWKCDIPIEEAIYEIDSDKLAYVQLIVDNASDYSQNHPFDDTWNVSDLSQAVDNRREIIANWLTDETRKHCREVLLITVTGTIGRTFFLGLDQQPNNSRTLVISVEDLEIITRLRECDNLTLWKYAGAETKLRNSTRITSFSTLDLYALYLKHHHSFYMSDDKLPDSINFLPGLGRSSRIKSAKIWDSHGALHGNPSHYVTVCRANDDENIPIYVLEDTIGINLEHLVEGYLQPIWVQPPNKTQEISGELRKRYFEVTSMFAYWLWQLTPSLRSHLEPLGHNPIHIQIQLENSERWDEFSEAPTSDNNVLPEFKTEIQKNNIVLTIPHTIVPYLVSSDNNGERLIIYELLKSFQQLLKIDIESNNLSEEECKRIVDVHVPLGIKKKLVLTKTERSSSLRGDNLRKFRLLQEHDIQEQLDGLVKELGDKSPPPGNIADKAACSKLCNDIVDIYLQRLKSILPIFDWRDLLDKLIGYNETVWHQRELMTLTNPTRIACYSDLRSQMEIIMKESINIDRTALSVRTLIEIVSAEPPGGQQTVSVDELDKLLAVTFNLVDWASLSDTFYRNIFGIRLSILDSGRVGIEREGDDDFWDIFLRSKTVENAESFAESFQDYFNSEKGLKEGDDRKAEYEKAFHSEFGFGLTDIVSLHSLLTFLGFEQKTSSPSLHLSELKNEIKKNLQWADPAIDEAVTLFSLVPRKKWEEAPVGFTKQDIYPWRFNRRLSFLRRPLIIGPDPKDDPLVFWGPRHTEKAGMYLLTIVAEGRYKLHAESSEEMKTLVGSILDNSGKEFNNEVKKWFENNTDWPIYPKVLIGPHSALESSEDLGDVDILAIDNANERIFSIECKHIHYARTPWEIADEIKEVIGDKDTGDSWVQKHVRRHRWLTENVELLSSFCKSSLGSHKISSFFLTAEEIPATYVREMPLTFISFTRLRREGISKLSSFST